MLKTFPNTFENIFFPSLHIFFLPLSFHFSRCWGRLRHKIVENLPQHLWKYSLPFHAQLFFFPSTFFFPTPSFWRICYVLKTFPNLKNIHPSPLAQIIIKYSKLESHFAWPFQQTNLKKKIKCTRNLIFKLKMCQNFGFFPPPRNVDENWNSRHLKKADKNGQIVPSVWNLVTKNKCSQEFLGKKSWPILVKFHSCFTVSSSLSYCS